MDKKIFKKWHKALKHAIQTRLIQIGKALLDRAPKNGHPHTPQNLQSVLFLRPDGKIGDYIVSSFAFRELKKSNPAIKIGVICTEKNQDLFQNNPYIDHFYLVKSKSIVSYYITGKKLARQYQIVVDPTVFTRNRDLVLLRALAAQYNIGYLKQDYRIFNLNIHEPLLHTSETYKRILQLCGLNNIDTRYDIPEPTDPTAVTAFLNRHQLTNYLAVNFFGAANSRRFSQTRIEEFLHYFQQHLPEKKIVLLTYPEVTARLQPLSEKYENVFIYTGTRSILDSAVLIKHADWVISPDTAIIHIASGFNKKIIGFYPDNAENTAYWHPNSINETHMLFFKEHIDEISPQQLPPIR